MKCLRYIIENNTEYNQENGFIICAFAYGSRVYGTNTAFSDYDYICIVNDSYNGESQVKFEDGDITFYTENEFRDLLKKHEISALECLWECKFVYNEEKQKEFEKYFYEVYDIHTLRSALSAKASNSWSKFHKKLTVEKDYNYDVGIKSLFHSIRIFMFGWEIAQNKKINLFSIGNPIWEKIQAFPKDTPYEVLKEQFKPIYKQWHSYFVSVAPKKIEKDEN